jgi:drug/metabolite transporter (DMT)-like permease
MQRHFSPIWILLLGAAFLGVSPILPRLSEVGPIATAFWRMALAIPFFLLWERPKPQVFLTIPWKQIVLAGLFFAGDLSVWHIALHYTTVANATLLTNCAPIFVTIGAWLLWRETVTMAFMASVALTLFGAGMLTGLSLSMSPAHFIGDSLSVLSALFYSLYFLSIRSARDSAASSCVIMIAVSLACGGFLLSFSLLRGEVIVPSSFRGWSVLIALALFTQAIGQTLVTVAMAHLKTSVSAMGLLLQPVVAAAIAWFLFDEVLGPTQLVGGVIVLIGVYLVSRKPG